MLQKQFDDEYN